MMHIKDWLNTSEIKAMRDKSMGELSTIDFFRDPIRMIHYNPSEMYAPADGVVLYAKEFDADDFLDIKGKDFTLKNMLSDETYSERSMVIGIFMTSFSVHINRVPIDSFYLDVRASDKIITRNVSMLVMEHELIDELRIDKKALNYLKSNEKQVSIFYSPIMKQRYYVVQVGDKDIDVIVNWGHGNFHLQGDRFGNIRWGSQCDLVVPIKKGKKLTPLVKPLDYVEAGKDAVIKIEEVR